MIGAAQAAVWSIDRNQAIASIRLGALALSRVLSDLLFGVSPLDPLTFVVVTGALLVAALAACWLPARRAMHVEPVMALRGDS